MLAEREKIKADVQQTFDEQADTWGTKAINAEGGLQAAQKLLEAGRIMSEQSEAMQLRCLGALLEIAGGRSSAIVFPIPLNWLAGLAKGPPTRTGNRQSMRLQANRIKASGCH